MLLNTMLFIINTTVIFNIVCSLEIFSDTTFRKLDLFPSSGVKGEVFLLSMAN
jgi:hypothetical protein